MTVNTSIIHAAGGGDYTTLATWEADTDNDLVTATTQEIGYISGTIYEGHVIYKNATVNSDYYRVLAPYPGTKHTGTSGTGSKIVKDTADANTFVIVEENFFSVSGLEVAGSGNNDVFLYGNFAPSSGGNIANCLIHDLLDTAVNSNNGIEINTTGTFVNIFNNVFWNLAGAAIRVKDANEVGFNIVNNTIHNVVTFGGNTEGGMRIKDALYASTINNNLVTLVQGEEPAFQIDGSGNVTGSGNASFDTTAFGVSSGIFNVSGVDIYTSDNEAIGYDFSIASGGAPIVDKGVVSTLVTTDISGATRPANNTWDIGAFEFGGAVPAEPEPPPNFGTVRVMPRITVGIGKISF